MVEKVLTSELSRSRITRGLRVLSVAAALAAVGVAGFLVGNVEARPQLQPADGNTLRVHGYPVVSNPNEPAHTNRPATAGSNTATDPNTGRQPEDPPYTTPQGPFDPLSAEAPEMDFVTWNPAWISERLTDAALLADWPGLQGVDEVSAGSNIRAGGANASEKVWLRHWYEPQHLDKDLNADGRLTDRDNNGVPDAPMNPTPSNVDEWYPAIMTEFTYMLVGNDLLPQADPDPSGLHRSAPRAVCATNSGTRIVFPAGTALSETNPAGPLVGYGATSLDVDFDGSIDMINVTDETGLAAVLGGTTIDFDGDGVVDVFDTDGVRLSGDEMVVMYTDAIALEVGEQIQFLDHFVRVSAVTDSGATLQVYYNGDLVPRLMATQSVGIDGTALAGDAGPVEIIGPGGTNLGSVPTGPWFVHVLDSDATPGSQRAVLIVGRALGAAYASMEAAPNTTNRSAGGPWFLKRFYVDGHEYNITAIDTCSRTQFRYITVRAPLPKVPVTIEQHSVRLQPYDFEEPLALLPPFNHEHTILEDILAFEGFADIHVPPNTFPPFINRPDIIYMGGPIGPIPPVLGQGDTLPYTGRDPANPVGPYNDPLSTRWFYVEEATNPQMLGQLREKVGAFLQTDTGQLPSQSSFFYNEQIWTMPWHYTEFFLPDQLDSPLDPQPYDADRYHVTSAFTAPTARWRRWEMPDVGVPAGIPPTPPDLVTNATEDGGHPLGRARRAVFWFDPNDPSQKPVKLWTDDNGARLYGGQPQRPNFDCDRRVRLAASSGDDRVTTDTVGAIGAAVEVFPYTDPWAPFNPQHAHAPRGDSMTVNPAYMDEFRNFDEPLRILYGQISNDEQNSREKVYHRLWYEPEYTTKIRFNDDCELDLVFPALMQEYTYLYMDTTDNPSAAPAGNSRFAFPIGTRADELPAPLVGGTLPPGGEFGYGLTTFDANFDDQPETVTVHSEQTLAAYLDAQWQSHRPTIPGFPLPVVAGPILDFDGDGNIDDLDEDCTPMNGNEMVVFAVQSISLDLDPNTPETASAMILDHLVTLENVTRGARGQFRFWFTGGNGANARPETVGGLHSLDIGDAAIVDRFQSSVTIVNPGGMNLGVDGAWFVFVEDVAADSDRVTVTVGRALGATHSAIDDGAGNHDLAPGDPWYLKRFYVDGHEYNVVALKTRCDVSTGEDLFEFITIRTPVPKGNFFNSQDTLFQQGYFLNGLPDVVSVMPPFNVRHTIAVDIERLTEPEFANSREYDPCVGDLAPFGALVERIVEEEVEPRYGTELLEIFWPHDTRTRSTWQTDQTLVIPNQYTDVQFSPGQLYLYTSNWRSPVSRLHFYGCLQDTPPPFPRGVPALSHFDIAAAAAAWSPPAPPYIVPAPNQLNPAQPAPPPFIPQGEPPIYSPYFDARLGPPDVRVKLFYDPTEDIDIYVNRRPRPGTGGGIVTPTPTSSATATGTVPTPTATSPGGDTATPTPTGSATATASPSPTTVPGQIPPQDVECTLIEPFRIRVDWTDASTFETEFLVEVRVVGSGVGFAPVTTVPSTTMAGTGAAYSYTSPLLAADTTYEWRIQARNPGAGTASPYSDVTDCTTAAATSKAGCIKGKVYLQGRSDHSGTLIRMDGFPMAATNAAGTFTLCGVQPGRHVLETEGACYLPARADNVYLPDGGTVNLPYASLRGGDVNNDSRINLFDLVRVGADYRSSPPNDPGADCTLDNRVDLFDLVLVGSNYGVNGPIQWGSNVAQREAPAVDLSSDDVKLTQFGKTGVPVGLNARVLQDGDLAVDVTVSAAQNLWGSELQFRFDTEKLQVVDTDDRPGVQIEPGLAWRDGGTAWVAVNEVDNTSGTITFVASRLKPADALSGDLVLATIRLKSVTGDAESLWLTDVRVADSSAREIDVVWTGLDIVTRPSFRIYVPNVMNRPDAVEGGEGGR